MVDIHKTQHLSVFAIISVIVISFTFILNVIGINLIRKQGFQRNNQLFIILNLSILQILVLICVLIYWILLLAGMKETDSAVVWAATILSASRMVGAMIIVLLTLDRLIAIKYSLRHTIILSRRRLKVALTVSWLSCVVMFSILKSLTIDEYRFVSYVITAPVMDLSLLLFILYAYSYIFWRIRKRRRIFGNAPASSQQTWASGKQTLRVSTTIVISYVCLLVLPDLADSIAVSFTKGRASEIIRIIAYMLSTCYLITVPMTYIFVHRDMRRMFLESVMKCCNRTGKWPNNTKVASLRVRRVQVRAL